jgi:integrase
MDNPATAPGMEKYQVYLRLARLAETTKETYRHYIEEFQDWAIERNLPFSTMTAMQVLDWADEHQWSSSTRYGAMNAIRSYYIWRYGRMHDIAINAKARRQKDPGPQRSLDWEQLDSLFNYFDVKTSKGIRDRAMIALLVDTGLREAEVCRADLPHLNRRKRQIDVIIKGGKWGVAEYFEKTAGYLNEWLAIRDSVAQPGAKQIFVSIGGTKHGTGMTPGGLRAIFRRIGKKAGIGAFSPHDCRRTMATLAAKSGAPSVVIQHAGRWSSLAMVDRYTRNLKPSDLKPFSPMDNLNKPEE